MIHDENANECILKLTPRASSERAATLTANAPPDLVGRCSMDEIGDRIAGLTEYMVENIDGNIVGDVVITIDIKNPDVDTLSMTDVPGLVSVENGTATQRDIQDIRNLINVSITPEQNVVVCVMDASFDLANAVTLNLAREVDPHEMRTIGVLSKADKIDAKDASAVDGMCKLLNGDSEHKLNEGFYLVCCKENTDEDLILTADHFALRREQQPELEKRMGIPALRSRLSSIIFEKVQLHRPTWRATIEAEIDEAEKIIELLGQPLSSARQQMQVLHKLARDLGDEFHALFTLSKSTAHIGHPAKTLEELAVDGDPSQDTLVAALDSVFGASLRPWMIYCDETFATRMRSAALIHPVNTDLLTTSRAPPPSATQEVEGGVDLAELQKFEILQRSREAARSARESLKRTIQLNRDGTLRGIFPPYSVFCSLFRETHAEWSALAGEHLDTLMRGVKVTLDHVLDVLVAANNVLFDQFRALEDMIRTQLEDLFSTIREEAETQLDTLLEHEIQPHTLDVDLSKTHHNILTRHVADEIDRLEESAENGMIQITPKTLRRLALSTGYHNDPSPQDLEAIEINAALDAYQNTVVRTLIDKVPEVAIGACTALSTLLAEAGMVTDDNDEDWDLVFREDPSASRQRDQAERTKKNLLDMRAICRKIR